MPNPGHPNDYQSQLDRQRQTTVDEWVTTANELKYALFKRIAGKSFDDSTLDIQYRVAFMVDQALKGYYLVVDVKEDLK